MENVAQVIANDEPEIDKQSEDKGRR